MDAIFLKMPTSDLLLLLPDGRVLVIEPDGDCFEVPGEGCPLKTH